MKFKKLFLISTVALLFACNGAGTSQNSDANISENQSAEAFTLFKDAITFKTNTAFTGYRLTLTIKNMSTNEQTYYMYRTVAIDNVNNATELTETVTRISDSLETDGEKITETTHYYYTLGSIIVQLEDGRYEEKDGIITKSTGLPTFNPTVDSFDNLNVSLTGNVVKMSGDIIASKANDLFATTGLENIQNAKMEANIYDDKLENTKWTYELNGFVITQSLIISYSTNIIVPPAL